MSDLISQVFQAFNSRLRSPFLGYFFLGQVYLNYRAFVLLFWGSDRIELRLEEFSGAANFQQFVLYPISFAIFGGVFGPWITYVGAWIAKWPAERLKKLQNDEARKMRIHDFKTAADELEAEAEHNLKRVAVEKSLKLAEQVGGEDLVRKIKSDSSRITNSSSKDGKEEQNVEADWAPADKQGAGSSTSDPMERNTHSDFDKEYVAQMIDDYWNLHLSNLISEFPDESAGKTAVLTVEQRNTGYHNWQLNFPRGETVGLGQTDKRSNQPANLLRIIEAGLLKKIDDSRFRISKNLLEFKQLVL